VLARVLSPSTGSLLDRLDLRAGMTCLDAGCGGGDVTVELARRVGPGGKVVGVDVDEHAVALARQEASAAGIDNIAFRAGDIRSHEYDAAFDLVYARFLLTHLGDPAAAVATLVAHLRPGGVLAVEDIDFSGAYTWPPSESHRRYLELYCAVVRKRGGDPDIGKRLPLLLADGGLEGVEMHIVQPMGTTGEMKLLDPITMDSIAESAIRDGLASPGEVEAVGRALYRAAEDPGIIAGLPRIVQTWGRRASQSQTPQ